MAQDRPAADDILATIREFIDRLMPTLPEPNRFDARVAIHLLQIVERELKEGDGHDAAETERLRRLLGRDGDLAELNDDLCRRIRAGAFDDDWDAVLAHVSKTSIDKVRIVDPRHLEKK